MIQPISLYGPLRSLTSLGMRTALIVDDVESMRVIVDRTVRQLDVATVQAGNGRDAFDQLQQHPIDVVITDIEMPVWSGFDLLEAIRGSHDPRLHAVPVVVISSLPDRAILARTKQYAETYFLPKPVSIPQLRVTLKMIATRIWVRDHPIAGQRQ
ncbi:Chemotaxis protein CheY [Stieleria neptunia]|uniref:Chemotaxis protein CheY n=1 Tax=Stieleria neptunia TaxID=2527979 RepID=A0A518HHN7_9BACT|nr:response regulator [Stieleria neptunia]QDV40354.1 Chemotaxis protein CheY [Stieleria neptunia]